MKIDTLVATYVSLRDRKAAIEKEAKAEEARLSKLMDIIELKLKETMTLTGTKSLKTDFGTAYITYKESATVADWDVLFDFIKRSEQWDLIEHRVSKTAVKNLMEEDRHGNYVNPPPPGVNFTRFEAINIRRS